MRELWKIYRFKIFKDDQKMTWLWELNAFKIFRKYFKANYNHHANATPANIYLFKINNRNIRKRCEICSKLTIKPPERHHWRHSGVFLVNFKQISQLFLVFLLLTEVSLLQNGKCLTTALTWPRRICKVYKMVAYTLDIMQQTI